MPRGRTRRSRSTSRSRTTSRSRRSTSRSSNRSGSPRDISALHRSMQRQRHNITLRGRRTNNARAPQGLPLEGNYIPVHRLGSRVRTPSQSMMQQERQMMRRRPHITALRLAHSRPINMENPSNVKKFVNPYLAENIALHPMMAKTGRSKYNKLNSPLPISAMAQRLSLSPSRGIKAPPLESELWQQWQERQMQIHRERSRAY